MPHCSFAKVSLTCVALSLASLSWLVACGKSPVDAIVPERSGPGPDAGDSCSTGVAAVESGLFRLRTPSGQCLSVGGSTVVVTSPAHLTVMVDDCATSEVWELTATTTSGAFGFVYELRSTTHDEQLDIKMGMTADGTIAVTFAATGNSNQKFQFRSRREGVFALAPAHVPFLTSCLASTPQPEIVACSDDAVDQEWMLIPAECS